MINKIKNINKLADALESNEFYDFHDAEIVSIKFNRNESVNVTVVLQLSRTIAEFEKDGKYFDRFKKFDAEFKFSRVYPFDLKDFNHQNVINELQITEKEGKYNVHFVEGFGADFAFQCEGMELIAVEIFEIEKVRYNPDYEKIKAGF